MTIYHFNTYQSIDLKGALFIFFYFSLIFLHAQGPIVGVRSFYNDDLREWVILAPAEENDGRLQMTWELRNDWTEWDFEFLDLRGDIEQRRDNDPEYWELRIDNQIIQMRTVWPGDRSEWSISDGVIKLVVKTRFNHIADEWLIQNSQWGEYLMYTEWEGDPRDWIIEDYLSEEVSLPMRIAIMHLVLMQSIPKP